MKRVLILGGSGFIGTRLLRRILRRPEYECAILDKVCSAAFPELTEIADVRSLEALRTAVRRDDIIINLAAEHRDDVRPKSLYRDVNVGGARNICAIAREKDVQKIVFTSSVAVYGFAPVGTDESGAVVPFNDYGQTKYEAEQEFVAWQRERPTERSLVIIRPTAVFGEQNRGNVYNLLKQISSGRFVMVGSGTNKKSLAYVENIASFLEFSLDFGPGVHLHNYVDMPDLSMNQLIGVVRQELGRPPVVSRRLPFWAGYSIGRIFDAAGFITKKRFAISAIRVKKFCADTVFSSSAQATGFKPPVSLEQALRRTVKYEFIDRRENDHLFYSE